VNPFACLVADPAWKFRDKLPGDARGAENNYKVENVKQIAAFDLPPLADDGWLFLWRVAAMQSEALHVMRAWGFELKCELVWVKTCKAVPDGDPGKPRIGMGHTVRNAHETCLIGRRRRGQVLSHSVPSVFFAPRKEHSRKPDLFFKVVESLVPGPRAELFAREKRPGWTCFGDEVETGGKLGEEKK